LLNCTVGQYFGFNSGRQSFKILSINLSPPNTILTVSDSTTNISSQSTTALYDQKNCFEWHAYSQNVVLQLGQKVYISDYTMNSWTEVIPNAKHPIGNSRSVFRTYNTKGILFNSNGLYLVDFDLATPVYYPINAQNPDTVYDPALDYVAQSMPQPTNAPYTFRYLNTFSRLKGVGDRTSKNVVLQLESGTAVKNDFVNGNYEGATELNLSRTDYCEVSAPQQPVFPEVFDTPGIAGNLISLFPHEDNYLFGNFYHWTHYSVYRTLDLGPNGIGTSVAGQANGVNDFYWLDDVPVIKMFEIPNLYNGGPISPMLAYDTHCVYSAIFTSLNAPWVGFSVGTKFYGTLGLVTRLDGPSFKEFLPYGHFYGAVGANNLSVISKTGRTITKVYGDGFTGLVRGQPIWLNDGTIEIVDSVIDDSNVQVFSTSSITQGAAAWNPIERYYSDYLPDDSVQVRGNGFLLKSRFMQPLPNLNIGDIGCGFLLGAISGSPFHYYSQTGYAPSVGYYNPFYQTDHLDDIPVEIEFGDTQAYIIMSGSTLMIDLSTSNTINSDDTTTVNAQGASLLGAMPIAVLTSKSYLSKAIGALCANAVKKSSEGFIIVITQDKEVRTLSPNGYSANLIAGMIMKQLEQWQSAVSIHFDKRQGILIYGTTTLSG
jgi:hypothetical protein